MRRSTLALFLVLLSAGCSQPSASPGTSDSAGSSAPPSPSTVIVTTTLDTVASVGISGSGYGQTPAPAPFKIERGNNTGGTATAYWNSTVPTAKTLIFTITDKPDFGSKTLAKATGPSPLTLTLPSGLPPGTYGAEVDPDTGSATVADHVEFVIVLHYG